MRTKQFVDSIWFPISILVCCILAAFYSPFGIPALALSLIALWQSLKDEFKVLREEADEKMDDKILTAATTLTNILREQSNRIKQLEELKKTVTEIDQRLRQLEGHRNLEGQRASRSVVRSSDVERVVNKEKQERTSDIDALKAMVAKIDKKVERQTERQKK